MRGEAVSVTLSRAREGVREAISLETYYLGGLNPLEARRLARDLEAAAEVVDGLCPPRALGPGDPLPEGVEALRAEVERLRRSIETRSHATVYERAAWQHDIGEHAGTDLPVAFCPRCEIEHPLGRLAEALRERSGTDAPA